jgi:hypothetical protein
MRNDKLGGKVVLNVVEIDLLFQERPITQNENFKHIWDSFMKWTFVDIILKKGVYPPAVGALEYRTDRLIIIDKKSKLQEICRNEDKFEMILSPEEEIEFWKSTNNSNPNSLINTPNIPWFSIYKRIL